MVGALAVVVGVLVVCGWLGYRGYRARTHLLDVRAQVTALKAQVSDGDTRGLQPALTSVQHEADRARALTGDVVWRLASHLPLVGSTFRTSAGLAAVTDDVARRALPPLVASASTLDPHRIRRPDGSVDLAPMARTATPLGTALSALHRETAAVLALPGTGTMAAVSTARTQLLHQLTDLTGTVDSARRAATVGPAMLGAAGPRRYFVVLQNPAEARGTGGLAGSFAVLVADRGRLHLERTGDDGGLVDSATPVVELGPEYQSRWSDFHSDRAYKTANFTAHFPWAAAVWQKLYERQSGEKVDGVLAVDPVALGYLLKITGRVTLSDGFQLNGGNVPTWALSDEYRMYPSNDVRKARLTELTRLAFDRIAHGNGSSAELLKALGRAAGERRVLSWAARPEEQAALAGTPLAGEVPASPAPYAGLVVNEDAGTKLSYYLDRSVDYRTTACRLPDKMRLTRITVRLTNNVRLGDLTDYVRGAGYRAGVPRGQDRIYLSVMTTKGAVLRSSTLNGKPFPLGQRQELGHPSFSAYLELPVHQQQVLTLELVEPDPGGAATVPVQPLVRPMAVTVENGRCH